MINSGISYSLPGTVSGVFFTKKDADMAYHALLKLGHTHDDISVLMSDETLNKYERPHSKDAEEFVTSEEVIANEVPEEKPKGVIVRAIISITSMISIPGLGIAISNTLLKKIYNLTTEEDASGKTVGSILSSSVPEEHTGSYVDSMKEGGIIISVDPRNSKEKKDIVKNFRENNGQDILGDDGYTEF